MTHSDGREQEIISQAMAALARRSHARRRTDPDAYRAEQSRRGKRGGWPKGRPRKPEQT